MLDPSMLMQEAVTRKASDLHLSVHRAVTFRVRGGLAELPGGPVERADLDALIRKIAPDRSWKEYEEVGSADFAIQHTSGDRFRVSICKERGEPRAVLRLIPTRLLSFDEIGLPDSVKDLLMRPRGLILVTGPTGSGKTTTLATMIDWINRNQDVHLVTIEDPIEYFHKHQKSIVTQREVGTDVPTFAEAMRRVLRQDPDVILLGEMRDLETISSAITAAETGHLVFGTLHTTGAARTVDRIIDAYPTNQQEQIRAQLSVAMVAVISQILIPRADGRGLCAAFEILITNSAVENHIRKNETFKIPSVIQTSRRAGMILLDDFLLDLVKKGTVTRETALEYAQSPRDLETRLPA
ncbi:MAG: PilT/PilU family type 4a pilus ATPase [Planctomycetes bacterium]|nr:PilT/PilU family type 4a pilus ATPase [Planctomycetota bacterium]